MRSTRTEAVPDTRQQQPLWQALTLRLAWALAGLLALAWFLIRVIPKPSRAAYPCQRAAFPIASAFVIWIAGMVGVALGLQKAKRLRRQGRVVAAVACTAVAALCLWVPLGSEPAAALLAPPTPNTPIGESFGIHPGRVVWVHDPNATDWLGTDPNAGDIGDGYWWQPHNTDQVAVDAMLARAVQTLAGESTLAAAWDALFRSFNARSGHGDVGYTPGERIMIKPNLVTANISVLSVDPNGNQYRYLNFINTSPQLLLALLDQLVNVVGVAPADISLGDTTAYFPNHYWDYLHTAFPEVHYIDNRGTLGREQAVSSQGQPCESRMYWSTPAAAGKTPDFTPTCYAEATYMINAACLKGHSSGITLSAKNHYGSLIRLPGGAVGGHYSLHLSLPNAGWSPGMAHYRALVDVMAHPDFGGKTVLYLVDGLYGGYYWEGRPFRWQTGPFNNDWPSSLFVAQDPVALDSVCYDLLLAEWPSVVDHPALQGGAEDYIHEAALAHAAPSGTVYNPGGGPAPIGSQGVHEHWDNQAQKRYTQNLGGIGGIHLLRVERGEEGDLDCDGAVTFFDIDPFVAALSGEPAFNASYPGCNWFRADCNNDGHVDFFDIDPFVARLGAPNR